MFKEVLFLIEIVTVFRYEEFGFFNFSVAPLLLQYQTTRNYRIRMFFVGNNYLGACASSCTFVSIQLPLV